MTTQEPAGPAAPRHDGAAPSSWVKRFADLVPAGGTVLDLACGGGRHVRFFLDRGHPVVAVDRDLSGLAALGPSPRLERIEVDLESDRPWPLAGRQFAGVVVTNYLHRPILPAIVAAVAPGGALVYETFALGNERFGRPSNPAFLLQPDELLEAVRGHLQVVAYEYLTVAEPRAAFIQRIAAKKPH